MKYSKTTTLPINKYYTIEILNINTKESLITIINLQ